MKTLMGILILCLGQFANAGDGLPVVTCFLTKTWSIGEAVQTETVSGKIQFERVPYVTNVKLERFMAKTGLELQLDDRRTWFSGFSDLGEAPLDLPSTAVGIGVPIYKGTGVSAPNTAGGSADLMPPLKGGRPLGVSSSSDFEPTTGISYRATCVRSE